MAITKRAFQLRVLGKSLGVGILILCGFAFTASGQQSPVNDRFYQAIRTNDLAQLRVLVAENGANVKDGLGLTPLILAAAFGTKGAVNVLLDGAADAKAASNAGLTALHVAWNNEDVVRALLATQRGCEREDATRGHASDGCRISQRYR
jgi:ankyrin repeat protein